MTMEQCEYFMHKNQKQLRHFLKTKWGFSVSGKLDRHEVLHEIMQLAQLTQTCPWIYISDRFQTDVQLLKTVRVTDDCFI